jgi:hypothetical protein
MISLFFIFLYQFYANLISLRCLDFALLSQKLDTLNPIILRDSQVITYVAYFIYS